ncbi:MAG TPA: hypothetical protein V6D22_17315 [Candidatus Obscuribacterales bacterium]
MKNNRKSRLSDPDMLNSEAALARAAESARELARRTGTRVVYVHDGQRIKETPPPVEQPKKKKQK